MAEKENISPKDMSNLLNKKSACSAFPENTATTRFDQRPVPRATKDHSCPRYAVLSDQKVHQAILPLSTESTPSSLPAVSAKNAPHLRENIPTHMNYYGVKIDVPFNKPYGTAWRSKSPLPIPRLTFGLFHQRGACYRKRHQENR